MKKLICILIIGAILIGSFINFFSSQKTFSFLTEKIKALDSEIIDLRERNENLKDILFDNKIANENRHPIDVDYAREFTKSEIVLSTRDLVEIADTYAKKWKDEMNKYLILLKDELFSDGENYVNESQTKWEALSKANIELQRQNYNKMHEGGSIRHILAAMAYYENVRERALFLRALYDYKAEGNEDSYLSLHRSF